MFLKQLLLGLGLCAGLAAAVDEQQTPLTINNAEYHRLCEEGSPPDHVCFTFLEGDAKNVEVQITRGAFAYPPNDLYLKDDQMRDFTIDDTTKKFSMYWMDTHVVLNYTPIDARKGCYDLSVWAPEEGDARLWINDGERGEGIDLDTKPDLNQHGEFCSKWIRIHVGNDR